MPCCSCCCWRRRCWWRASWLGLVVAILQAATSIHEQTLSFVPKIFAVIGVALLLGPWLGASMVDFTTRLFESIPEMGAMP